MSSTILRLSSSFFVYLFSTLSFSLPHTPPFNSWEGEGLSFLPYVSILARLWFVGPFLCVLHIYINTMVLHIVRGWKLFNFLFLSIVSKWYLIFTSLVYAMLLLAKACVYEFWKWNPVRLCRVGLINLLCESTRFKTASLLTEVLLCY